MVTEERHRTVREILTEAKDLSELTVDLAYAAVFFDDKEIAEEVLRLEERSDELISDLWVLSMLAARTVDDARQLTGVVRVGRAIEKIAGAAVDVARVVLRDLGLPRELRADLAHAEEMVARVRVRAGSALDGCSLNQASLPTATGMSVIAIRRGRAWVFGPEDDEIVRDGDVLIVQGPEEGMEILRGMAGFARGTAGEGVAGEAEGEVGAGEGLAVGSGFGAGPLPPLSDLDRAVDTIVEMKNVAEVAVGLAYACLMYGERSLAAEVETLEARTDEMRFALERWVLRAAGGAERPEDLRGLLYLASASEVIGDAAKQIAFLVEDGEEVHPVLSLAFSQADEVVVRAEVGAGARADGVALAELDVERATGMYVLAVGRSGRWVYRPRPQMRLLPGDVVLATGPDEGRSAFRTLVHGGGPDTE